MWIVRFILLGLFVAQVLIGGFFMTRRRKYPGLFENRVVNLSIVVVYCLLCVLLAGLPSDPNVLTPPAFLAEPAVRMVYSVSGVILIGTAIVIWIVAVHQRKALGGQDVKAGLLTTGLYGFFRHPIYAAIVWGCLGVALLLGTWDGLLMIPFVLLLNAAEAFLEERCDVGVRFSGEYKEYRKRTGMFGPLWIWVSLAVVLVLIPLGVQSL